MAAPAPPVAVLFDFDGTVGDTETPAMEVAFWEIAPYLPHLAEASRLEMEAACPIFIRENAGKAFEHMIEACDELRLAAGLPAVEEVRKARAEPARALFEVDAMRSALGLPTIGAMRSAETEPLTLLAQQKSDTVARLGLVTRPTPGMVETLERLKEVGVAFVIATTSGKPRVPVCVDAAGLRPFFPCDEAHIHSGESDFNPPKFKPAPDVYLRAAASVSRQPCHCIAVEDSASGVGSASNAGIGLIVGYVGASHIGEGMQEAHASMLMAGTRADNQRGADVVISHMADLPAVIELFSGMVSQGGAGDGRSPLQLPRAKLAKTFGQIYTRF